MKNAYLVNHFDFLDDYKLLITFTFEEKKVFDCKQLLTDEYYKELNDFSFFRKAHIEGHYIVWNDKIDINPEFLYENGVPYNE